MNYGSYEWHLVDYDGHLNEYRCFNEVFAVSC